MTAAHDRRKARYVVMLAALAGAICLQPISSPAEDIVPQNLIPPRLLKSPSKDFWPGDYGREARVGLRLTVHADGKVSDIELEDGFYDKNFAKAAVAFVHDSQWEPARMNGQPVTYEGYRTVVGFYLADDNKQRYKVATPRFRSALNRAVKLINEDQLAAAHEQVQHMVADEVKWTYEYSVLEAALAATYAATGNSHEALRAARIATQTLDGQNPDFEPASAPPENSTKRYMLDEPLLSKSLRQRFLLATSLGFALDALEAYTELAGLAEKPQEEKLAQIAAKLTTAIQSDQPLVASARIGQDGDWRHRPYRRKFSVADVHGSKLKVIALRCDKTERELAYQEGVDWTLPASWRRCEIRFRGEIGTEFKIVELADEARLSGPLH